MLSRDQHGGLEFATVPIGRVEEAVGRLKRIAPDEERRCPDCEYVAAIARWGIKIYGTRDPERLALVCCCPACESPIDLPVSHE